MLPLEIIYRIHYFCDIDTRFHLEAIFNFHRRYHLQFNQDIYRHLYKVGYMHYHGRRVRIVPLPSKTHDGITFNDCFIFFWWSHGQYLSYEKYFKWRDGGLGDGRVLEAYMNVKHTSSNVIDGGKLPTILGDNTIKQFELIYLFL